MAQLGPAIVYADRAEFGGDPADWQRAGDELTALGDAVAPGLPRRAALEAVVQTALGNTDTAMAVVSTALGAGSTGPNLAVLRAAEAEVALAERDWPAAAAAARAAIAADPLAWDARRATIRAELGRGDGEAALAAADDLLALLPGDGRGHYFRGMALASLGRAGEAMAAFSAARDALPASAVYAARIAEAIETLGSPVATPEAPLRIVLTPRARETPRAGVARSSSGGGRRTYLWRAVRSRRDEGNA
jgi:tetratricopeptide (TPR) repeat protein